MYLCDFVTIDDERYFLSADTRTGKLRFERVTNAAFEKFLHDILAPIDGEGIKFVASDSEVSA